MRSLLSNAFRGLFFICLIGFFSEQTVYAQLDDNSTEPEIKIDKFIFSIGYHRGWRLAGSDANTNEEEEYFRNLKRGGGIRLKGLIPLGDQRSAVGIAFNRYKSQTGRLMGASEFHEINYIGAVYQQYTRAGVREEHLLTLEYSLGYMSYQSAINGADAFDGGNIAASLGGIYRYMITPVLGVGVNLHLEGSNIREWTAPNGQTIDLGDGDNLFRISFGFGVDIRL